MVALLFTSLTAVSGSGAATETPALDNFECNTAAVTATPSARVPFPATPANVLLTAGSTNGFVANPEAVRFQCSPTQTVVSGNGHSVTTPVRHPDAHLACWTIDSHALTLPLPVTLKNQFGVGALKPTAVRSLCMPSWERSTTPLTFPNAPAPPNLDAYVCYNAVQPAGTLSFKPPASARLTDQFGTITASVGAANIVCAPTAVTANGVVDVRQITNPSEYSVCFAILSAKSPATPTVSDKNQFGIGAVKLGRSTEWCVPSFVNVTPPPTTSTSAPTTTTLAPTTTTTTLSGTPTFVTGYTDPSISSPIDIAGGPDGTMWFTNFGNDSIGRITSAGTVFNYTDPSVSSPDGITAGPDGAMWFTNAGNNSIGRITTAGVITNYTDFTISSPYDIAAGSDGALWFTNFGNNSIGRITTGGAVTNYTDPSISRPDGIAAGADGALWFANTANNSIGRITTTGTVVDYTDPSISTPYRITAGPDGAMWFTNSANNSIGRITTGGTITNYTDPTGSDPQGITTGADGALWFVNYGNSAIGRITTDGTVTDDVAFPPSSIDDPVSIAVGPDAALWFTNDGNNSIGRIGP
jgi:virginiamycin B lyase